MEFLINDFEDHSKIYSCLTKTQFIPFRSCASKFSKALISGAAIIPSVMTTIFKLELRGSNCNAKTPVRIMAMNPESAVVVATLDNIDTDLEMWGSSSNNPYVNLSASARISVIMLCTSSETSLDFFSMSCILLTIFSMTSSTLSGLTNDPWHKTACAPSAMNGVHALKKIRQNF